jgi:hypothetical protein
MTTSSLSDQVCGKTIRLSWTDGPTKGSAQDHFFHSDGTVEWQSAKKDGRNKPQGAASDGAATKPADRPSYVGMKITDEVCLVSYLSKSGYTLTVVLNFADASIAGVASNETTWVPVRGRFDLM